MGVQVFRKNERKMHVFVCKHVHAQSRQWHRDNMYNLARRHGPVHNFFWTGGAAGAQREHLFARHFAETSGSVSLKIRLHCRLLQIFFQKNDLLVNSQRHTQFASICTCMCALYPPSTTSQGSARAEQGVLQGGWVRPPVPGGGRVESRIRG